MSPTLEMFSHPFCEDTLTVTEPPAIPNGYTDKFVRETEKLEAPDTPKTKKPTGWKKQGKSPEDFRPNFAWLPLDRIKNTLKHTTQLYRAHNWGNKMKRHIMSRFPDANCQ